MTTVYDLSPGQAWDPAESRKGPLRDKPVLQHASETEQYSEDSRLYLEDVGRSEITWLFNFGVSQPLVGAFKPAQRQQFSMFIRF